MLSFFDILYKCLRLHFWGSLSWVSFTGWWRGFSPRVLKPIQILVDAPVWRFCLEAEENIFTRLGYLFSKGVNIKTKKFLNLKFELTMQ